MELYEDLQDQPKYNRNQVWVMEDMQCNYYEDEMKMEYAVWLLWRYNKPVWVVRSETIIM